MSEPRWSDMAAAYVLGTLDKDEHAAFEARLAVDESLRGEVDAYRESIAALGTVVPRHAPPSSLKTRILEEARRTPASDGPHGPGAAPTGATGATGAPTDRARDEHGATGGVTPIRPRTPLAPWLAAAAGLIAAVALGVLAQRIEQRRATLEGRLESVEAALDQTTRQLAERDSLLGLFLGSDIRTATLSATDQPPSARIFWNTQTSAMLVTAFDLPPAPDGRTYQLWGIATGSDPVSLGTFQTGADGTAVVQRTAPAGAVFEIGAITDEPTGGSPQPTTTPFLVGTWVSE